MQVSARMIQGFFRGCLIASWLLVVVGVGLLVIGEVGFGIAGAVLGAVNLFIVRYAKASLLRQSP